MGSLLSGWLAAPIWALLGPSFPGPSAGPFSFCFSLSVGRCRLQASSAPMWGIWEITDLSTSPHLSPFFFPALRVPLPFSVRLFPGSLIIFKREEVDRCIYAFLFWSWKSHWRTYEWEMERATRIGELTNGRWNLRATVGQARSGQPGHRWRAKGASGVFMV